MGSREKREGRVKKQVSDVGRAKRTTAIVERRRRHMIRKLLARNALQP